jgi:hypothetical protein
MPAYDAVLFSPPAPLENVTLRNPANGRVVSGVPMLLDSGADVTLVPRRHLADLHATIGSQTDYELTGFDGQTSIAPSIELHMIFLGRTFRGRFLVSDNEYGILGRNVLNCLSLVFDGPRLTWREESR